MYTSYIPLCNKITLRGNQSARFWLNVSLKTPTLHQHSIQLTKDIPNVTLVVSTTSIMFSRLFIQVKVTNYSCIDVVFDPCLDFITIVSTENIYAQHEIVEENLVYEDV